MEEIELSAKLVNGRLIIESVNKESSDALSKWIDENRPHFNKWLDMEILSN